MLLTRRLLVLALTVPLLAFAACEAEGGAKDNDTEQDSKSFEEVDASETTDDTSPGEDTAGPTEATWKDDILPMLTQYCSACHQATGCPSGVCFLSEDFDPSQDAAGKVHCPDHTFAECAVKRLEEGSMPSPACTPGAPGCPTADEMATLKAWAEAGAP